MKDQFFNCNPCSLPRLFCHALFCLSLGRCSRAEVGEGGDEAKGIRAQRLSLRAHAWKLPTCSNQATKGLEIKAPGWAFGQIADMEAWYTRLKGERQDRRNRHFRGHRLQSGRPPRHRIQPAAPRRCGLGR